MGELEEIDKKVYEMREILQALIKEKSSLLDPEVITASQKLDNILNEYNQLIKMKK